MRTKLPFMFSQWHFSYWGSLLVFGGLGIGRAVFGSMRRLWLQYQARKAASRELRELNKLRIKMDGTTMREIVRGKHNDRYR